MLAVLELLFEEVGTVDDLVVDHLAVLEDGDDLGVDKATVGFQVEAGVAFEDFLVELRVDVDGVVLHEGLAGFVVAFRLDALDFCEQVAEQAAEFLEVVDYEIGLAVADFLLDDVFGLAFLIAPVGDELAVLHVGLSVGLASTRLNCVMMPLRI